MKITVIGAGGAFAGMERGNSAFLVEEKDSRILIDCGTTTPYILRDEMGIPLESITDVIITHPHSDHVGGLEMILHACRWIGKKKPTIWCSPAVLMELDNVFNHLRYEADGSFAAHSWRKHHAEVCSGINFEQGPGWLPLKFYKVKHVGAMPANALTLGGLAVSGDTNVPVKDPEFWSRGLLVFHEAEFGFATGVHCPVLDLASHCVDAPDGWCVYAYHCPEGVEAPAPLKGVLRKGQKFEVIQLGA
jgi:hypothetical protein